MDTTKTTAQATKTTAPRVRLTADRTWAYDEAYTVQVGAKTYGPFLADTWARAQGWARTEHALPGAGARTVKNLRTGERRAA